MISHRLLHGDELPGGVTGCEGSGLLGTAESAWGQVVRFLWAGLPPNHSRRGLRARIHDRGLSVLAFPFPCLFPER